MPNKIIPIKDITNLYNIFNNYATRGALDFRAEFKQATMEQIQVPSQIPKWKMYQAKVIYTNYLSRKMVYLTIDNYHEMECQVC